MNEMTTRGTNPSSISPPVQIPQPRHVSIPSGTPPPNQHLYPGQSSGLVQGSTFSYIQPQYQQSEQFLPYQAYGSAPNDLRGASSSSGRGGTGPAHMAQSGTFYHQTNQNMRPSQPPPPNHSQSYYINPASQGNMRHPRPSSASNPPSIMFIQPSPNNMVISPNMYPQTPRMPMYTQGAPQYQRFNQPSGMMYFNGGQRPSVPMQTQGMGPPPAPREKRFINISDPHTGRNITDEIIKSSHQPSTEEKAEQDDSSANDKGVEIRKNFTRQVVERMKTGEASVSPNLQSSDSVNPAQPGNPSLQNQPSQEHSQLPASYPSGHLQQPQSTPALAGAPVPGSIMRPAIRMGGQAINLSVPPPQLPRMVYAGRQAPSQQTIPSQSPVPTPHVMPPKGYPPPPTSVTVVEPTPSSRSELNASVTQSVVSTERSTPSQVEPVIPQNDIPAHTEPASADIEAAHALQIVEGNPAPENGSHISSQLASNQIEDAAKPLSTTQTTVPGPSGVVDALASQTSTRPSPPAAESTPLVPAPVSDETKQPEIELSGPVPAKQTEMSKKPTVDTDVALKEESSGGASAQGNKDGRKGKKNKKDFSRKESEGSEMDAFIDTSNMTNNGSAPLAVSDTTSEPNDQQPDESLTSKQVINCHNVSTSIQVGNKIKLKKKKKKKNKKSATTPSVTKLEEPEDASKTVCTPSPLKVCENNQDDFSPSESHSHSSEGKDSGVDSEPGLAAQDQRRLSESKSQDKAPTPSALSDAKPQKAKEEESLPLAMPSQPVDKPSAVKEVCPLKEETIVKPDSANVQNGTELLKDNGSQKEKANVPNDNPLVVNSVPEVIPAEKDDDVEPESNHEHTEENETPKTEDVEPSKAEVYAKLKKSGAKLVYDRAYLIELRGCASSQAKPDGLPALEIILDQPSPFLSRTSLGPADFTPAFFQTGANQRHAPPIGKSSSRGRPRPGDMPGTPRVIKSISMSNDTKQLHQSDNPWKPTKKEEKDEQRSLEGDILFIMNRLTPTNFEKLAAEMKNLNIKTYDDLKFMVKTFFDKVTLETKFVEAYALLCKVMSGLKVAPPTDGTVKETMATFRVVMLTKCQQEFEADKSIIFEDPEEKKRKLEAENPEKTPEREELIEKTLYQMKLKRMKFYGNIRFIGELFKLGMLTESIMHDCIYRLLKARDDDSLVSLCNLLTTVGRNLDTEKARPRMDQYFSQMTKIADERKSRIKFTLRDVVELRQNNWVPRKQATGPKKIDEVHKDYAQEQMRNQYLASQPAPPRNDNSQAGSRRGSRQRPDENKMGEDGWNTVGNPKSFRIDASKMKISSKNVVDDNIQLGPGGGAHKQPIWSRGSHGGTQQPTPDDRPALGNRFSALTSDDARRSYPRSPSRGEGSAGRGLRQGQSVGHGRGKIISRSSQDGERRDAIANTRSFMGGRSQNSSRDNSWNRDDRRQFMGPRGSWERDNPMTRSDSAVRTEEFKTPAPPMVKQMSGPEVEAKAVNILDEYLNIRDLSEAKLCIKELGGQNNIHLVVTASINNVLEKRDDARHMTGNLFNELVKCNIISLDSYIKGLKEVLEYASDMVVDIPTLWNCLAQVITPLLVGGSLPWSKLNQAFSHLNKKDGAKLMAALLSQSVEKQGEKEIAKEWQRSGLSWLTYLNADELNSFVADKNLGFTLGSEILPDLEKMICDRASNSDLIAYIEKTGPGSDTASFIRALTTAVVSASINENKNINVEVIKNNKDILQRYLGNTVDLQLQALYAIQALMVKLEHPSGALSKLFELLYDEISMEEEAFYRWEKCNDPQEQDGKGTCLMQVRHFFIWLRENEEPDAES